MRPRILPTILLAIAAQYAIAGPIEDCEKNEERYSDEFCLSFEYKEADRLLARKLKQLLVQVGKVNPGVSNAALLKEMQLAAVKAVEASSRGWRQIMESECGVLLVNSFGTGSGAGAAAMQCRIDRTYERIKHLSSAPAYEWLW